MTAATSPLNPAILDAGGEVVLAAVALVDAWESTGFSYFREGHARDLVSAVRNLRALALAEPDPAAGETACESLCENTCTTGCELRMESKP